MGPFDLAADSRRHQLLDRLAATTSQTTLLLERSQRLRDAARDGRRNAACVRARSLTLRAASRSGRRYFRLDGVLEGLPVLAVLRPGEMVASPSLVDRAELLIAMGETFDDSSLPPLEAALTGPPQALMLTLLRACDRPLKVALGPAPLPNL